MPNSLSNCDVGIDFLIFLLLFLFPSLAFAVAAAAAASWESWDALSRVGLRTRLNQQGSRLELSVSGSVKLFAELSVKLSSDNGMLSVLGSSKS